MTGGSLADLRRILQEGHKRSMQGSYERRAPATSAIPYFTQAREGLRQRIHAMPAEVESWLLLSEAEEALLDYPSALSSLQRAVQLSGSKDKKHLKRLANLQSQVARWSELHLSPGDLAKLGEFLAEQSVNPGDRTVRWTTEWLQRNGFAVEEVLLALNARGAFSDFQVLYNVVRG